MQRYLGFIVLAAAFIVGAFLAKSNLFVSGETAFENKDYATALAKLQKADSPQGQYYLGTIYFNGLGTQKDPVQAVKWYTRAAKQGHPEAQFALGSMYAKGEGVQVNLTTAVDWYKKSALQNNSKAQFNLGIAYGTGSGVPRDEAEALKWIRKSAELGNERAQQALASLTNQPKH